MADILKILESLSRGGVDFVLVGGAAAAAYGSSMVTQDVDLCGDFASDNLVRLAEALGPFAPVHRMAREHRPFTVDEASSMSFRNLYLHTSLGQLDFLGEIMGIGGFPAVREASEPLDLEGFAIRILSLPKLIQSKEAMGRPRDLENAEILRMIMNKDFRE